jgi:hypothetical protein
MRTASDCGTAPACQAATVSRIALAPKVSSMKLMSIAKDASVKW